MNERGREEVGVISFLFAISSCLNEMFLPIIVSIAVMAAAYLLFSRKSATPTTDYPLVGSALRILWNWNTFYDWITQKTEEFGGKTWAFSIPFVSNFIVITDPDLCEYMLKTNFDNYEKGIIFRNNFHDFLGDGIFNVDGELWKMQRKRASHMFSVNSFKTHMLECFTKHGEVLISILESIPEEKAFDMNDLFMRYTLDSIGEIGFGLDIGSLRNPQHIFARSFDYIQNLANIRFFLPQLMKSLNPLEFQAPSHLRSLDQIASDCVANHKAHPDAEKYDFLAMFMNHKDNTDSFYKDLIMNFTIAGRDTTGLALSWMFWLLSKHPEVEEKVIKEIETEVGSGPVTFDAMSRLKYLDAVFSETLRLYPSVPKDGKMAVHDDVLPDGTAVPAGSLVVYFPYGMGRKEQLWPNAREFNPDRFVEQPKPSPYKFIAFQAGPRTCLGQRMAYLEAKVITTLILQRFRLRTQAGFEPKYSVNLTLSMRNGLMMNCHRVSK